ncbi:hypothetical protein BVG19_g2439 [[Candida] boidinii]|nr:hypothetical protein BVG19_g2439 [[Candida] boidinii]OWB49081.1 hypothetical protein B5S27_g620 [[Candida] boidinii]
MTSDKKRANSNSFKLEEDNGKKLKRSTVINIKQTPEEELQAKKYINQEILKDEFKENLKTQISESKPYNWGTIRDIFDDELMQNVRKEVINEINFTKKETDIYKVYQSGDLANLSGLSSDDLQRLPSLYKLRSAIYSKTFRDYVSYVTGCGKLSGIKTDISINTYTKGCHLLTHDDVIGSRRVSFILYMPEIGKTWKEHYGGALRLLDSVVPNVPQSDIHSKLVPQFNQIAFFRVQPGHSFHDVEEVKVDKQRLSIQGWFHIPQRGEDGFIEGEQELTEARSTLQQLESKELKEYDFPKILLNEISPLEIKEYEKLGDGDDDTLSEYDTEYLSKFMNLELLKKETILKLNDVFVNDSVIDIYMFLNSTYSDYLKNLIKHFEINEFPKMPTKQSEVKFPWKLAVPSHKQRYLYIDGLNEQDISTAAEIRKINQLASSELPNFGLTKLVFDLLQMQISKKEEKSKQKQDGNNNESDDDDDDDEDDGDYGYEVGSKLCELASFLKSISFRKWLRLVTGLVVVKDQILIRRFRPGQDFILATQLDSNKDKDRLMDEILEATLNLTPSSNWENGEFGGYELCMNSQDDDEDSEADGEKEEEKDERLNEDDAAIYKSSEKDDSVVYTSQACWNKLSLILKDSSILQFVKYVSFGAEGSRWDINCSFNLQKFDDESEDDE